MRRINIKFDIDEIFNNLESINEVISEQQIGFNLWLEEQRKNGVSDEDILNDINNAWGYTKRPFLSVKQAEEWFDDLGI